MPPLGVPLLSGLGQETEEGWGSWGERPPCNAGVEASPVLLWELRGAAPWGPRPVRRWSYPPVRPSFGSGWVGDVNVGQCPAITGLGGIGSWAWSARRRLWWRSVAGPGPCRVLLVDETSIRRRHRYVTVVACGDSGKILAMIPGRTKGSLSRFFRDQGAWWCRQVEIVVSDGILLIPSCHRAIPSRCPPCVGPLSRRPLVHPRPHPGAKRAPAPRPRSAATNIRT